MELMQKMANKPSIASNMGMMEPKFPTSNSRINEPKPLNTNTIKESMKPSKLISSQAQRAKMVPSDPIKSIEAVVPVIKPEKPVKATKSKMPFEDKVKGSKVMELLY